MGIPRLTSHLQPFADREVLGCSGGDLGTCTEHNNNNNNNNIINKNNNNHPIKPSNYSKIIIDGPGLAYWIYSRLQTCVPTSSSNNALEAAPSYDEIGKATLRYVDALAGFMNVVAIYFDGYLPARKRPVRQARLAAYLKQTIAYQAIHPKGLKRQSNKTVVALVYDDFSLFDAGRSISADQRGLPAPPFLVPAVIEALHGSSFIDVVHVVPGEADPYCAGAVAEFGGVVLTGDSDMLVHDLGPNGAVVFFNQLELNPFKDSLESRMLVASMLKPDGIAERLKVKDLQSLAFEIKKDSSLTLLEAIRRARETSSEAADIQGLLDFRAEYALKCNDFVHTDSPLDPRVSEVVLQASEGAIESSDAIDVYLPYLIEDPSRASAWAVSSELRHCAYSLLAQSTCAKGRKSQINEWRSRGYRTVPSKLLIMEREECMKLLTDFKSRIMLLRDHLPDITDSCSWGTLGLMEVCRWYLSTDRNLPSTDELIGMILGVSQKTLGWEDVHRSAQHQASLYSFRMLKQILHYCVRAQGDSVDAELPDLLTVMKNLPGLLTLIPSPDRPTIAPAQEQYLKTFIILMRKSLNEGDTAIMKNDHDTKTSVLKHDASSHKGIVMTGGQRKKRKTRSKKPSQSDRETLNPERVSNRFNVLGTN